MTITERKRTKAGVSVRHGEHARHRSTGLSWRASPIRARPDWLPPMPWHRPRCRVRFGGGGPRLPGRSFLTSFLPVTVYVLIVQVNVNNIIVEFNMAECS